MVVEMYIVCVVVWMVAVVREVSEMHVLAVGMMMVVVGCSVQILGPHYSLLSSGLQCWVSYKP